MRVRGHYLDYSLAAAPTFHTLKVSMAVPVTSRRLPSDDQASAERATQTAGVGDDRHRSDRERGARRNRRLEAGAEDDGARADEHDERRQRCQQQGTGPPPTGHASRGE